MAHENSHNEQDPLAGPWPYERTGYLWTMGALIVSITAVVILSKIDRHLYDSLNRYFDFEVWEENRRAWSAVPSEVVDERKHAQYSDVAGKGLNREGR